jgi:hypothetical protein
VSQDFNIQGPYTNKSTQVKVRVNEMYKGGVFIQRWEPKERRRVKIEGASGLYLDRLEDESMWRLGLLMGPLVEIAIS